MKTSTAVLLAVTLLLCGFQNVTAQAQTSETELVEVRDDLYVIMGLEGQRTGGNTTVLVTDEGVVLIDTKFEERFDDIMAKVRLLTDLPVEYVFNSHSHRDHTGGNVKVATSATIIAHHNARVEMVGAGQPGPPQLTYDREIRLHLGGQEVVARHFRRAHTSGDTFVYFPRQRVLASGDSFNTGDGAGLTGPTLLGFHVAYPAGSVVEMLDTIDGVLEWDFDVVIPGHGPPGTRADVVRWREEIEAMINRIREMVLQGRSKEDVQSMLVEEFGWNENMRAYTNDVDGLMEELRPR